MPLQLIPPSTVTVRALGPHDGDVLDAVFAGLSDTSRYLRFHAGTPRMTADVRQRLAAVDGTRHLAVGAFAGSSPSTTEPIGIARLVTVGPGRAELAVEVVDAWQGCGVGTRLVRSVLALGAAAGITEVVAEVLAGNRPARRLLATVLPGGAAVADGPEITFLAHVAGSLPSVA